MKSQGLVDPETIAQIVKVSERRFSLRVHTVLHANIVDCVIQLLATGVARSTSEVVRRLESGPDSDPVIVGLHDAISIGETYFYRLPQQLRMLLGIVRTHVLVPGRKAGPLKIWSAGCATGEEAYTLAMLFRSAFSGISVRVIGTDSNAAALRVARTGVYGDRSLRGDVPKAISTGLERRGGSWEVTPEIRKCVSFETFNLVTSPLSKAKDLRGFDVVVCRHVLLYIEPAMFPTVLEKLAAASAPQAVLALTPAEYPSAAYLAEYEGRAGGMLVRFQEKPKPRLEAVEVQPEAPATPAKAPRRAAPTIAEELKAAQAEADRNRFEDALQRVSAVLAREPTHAVAQLLKGTILAALGRDAEALVHYKRAVYLEREFVAAEIALGQLLARMGQASTAERHLRRAVRLLEAVSPASIIEPLGLTAGAARQLALTALRGRVTA